MSEGGSHSEQKEQEIPFKRVKVLFHGTNDYYSREIVMKEIGLLGQENHPTLTTHTSTLHGYSTSRHLNPLATIWYPQRFDMDQTHGKYQSIRRDFDEDEKESIAERIRQLDILDVDKTVIINDVLFHSDRLLPGDRLGSIVVPNDGGEQFKKFAHILDENGLQLYTQNKEELLNAARTMLAATTITYLQENLTEDQLALDIVDSSIQDQMLTASEDLNIFILYADTETPNRINSWKKWEKKLQSITFAEPVLERYRNMLLRKYSSYKKFDPVHS